MAGQVPDAVAVGLGKDFQAETVEETQRCQDSFQPQHTEIHMEGDGECLETEKSLLDPTLRPLCKGITQEDGKEVGSLGHEKPFMLPSRDFAIDDGAEVNAKQPLVTLEDVALLDPAERALHREVMEKSYQNLVFLADGQKSRRKPSMMSSERKPHEAEKKGLQNQRHNRSRSKARKNNQSENTPSVSESAADLSKCFISEDGQEANHPMTMNREKVVKKRKYSEDFLQYGFTSVMTAGIEKPQCVICGDVLSAESMKPNKLKRHFDCKHASLAGKDTSYFRSKADGLKKARLDTGDKCQKQNVAAVEASYLVALRIARAMKPHTIAKDLLLPAAKDIVRVMFEDEFVPKLSAISLSNDTVRRRIDDMSADILDQVIQEIKSSPLPIFSIQLDESTDVANCAQLLVYVRYVNGGDFKDEFLFCKPLETATAARDVFDTVGSFLNENQISWEKVCGVCTDGASAMLGCRSGFQSLVQNESPRVIGTHCMIHWQVLAMKTLPQELQEVMTGVISSVNFVKASSLNSRVFSQLCNELDAPNNALLFHTEVRWLSRGNVLKRVFELRDELKTFFHQKARPQFEALFGDKSELQKIAYLVDIFAILNELNLSLQGPNATCLDLSEKIPSFQMKLQLWQKKMDENKIYMLPTLSAFFEEHDIRPDQRSRMIMSVKGHLRLLADEISSYFPNLPDVPFALVRSPFTVRVEDVPEAAQEEFIELINSGAARTDFSTMPLTKFWVKCLQSYPVLSETVLRLLLPFPTTCLCEAGFSSLLVIKSKYRNRLVVEDDLRCALAKTAPRISELVRKKQSQPSH